MFEAPIPGESLTRPPKQYPWERPPEIVDPEVAIQYYVDKMTDVDAMNGIMDALEVGYTIKDLTEGLLRVGVSEGLHTIDVSLLVAPVIHGYIKSVADQLNVPYEEGFEDKAEKKKAQDSITLLKASLSAKKQKDVVSQMNAEETQEPVEEAMPIAESKGLMSRRMK